MASNNTLVIFTPFNNEPPSSSFATLGIRNLHPILNFDDSVDESSVFTAILPKQYSGNGVTVYIHYCMVTDISNSVKWDVSFERIGESVLDIDSDSFTTEQTVTDTVPATAGMVGIAPIVFTDGAQMDALAAGEAFRLKLTRGASTDTAIGDAQLIAIEIREN